MSLDGTDVAVSVVIPARNEAAHIAGTIDSFLQSVDVPGAIDIIVADGGSTDATAAIVTKIAAQDDRVRLIANPAGYAAHGFNLGIRAARGRNVMIMSAHARVAPDHLAMCVRALDENRADIAGGVIVTVPNGTSDEAVAVWATMTSALGFGPSRFRTGAQQPMYVDTIGAGMMRRDVFSAVGLFDEDLIRGQDDEFNARARAAGKRLLLLPHLKIDYVARATIPQLFNMCFQYGAYKPVSNLKAGTLINLRQFAPVAMLIAFSLGLLGAAISPWSLLACALIVCGYVTLAAATVLRAKRYGLRFFILAFLAFVAAHTGYGLGYMRGLFAVARFGRGAARALARMPNFTALTR